MVYNAPRVPQTLQHASHGLQTLRHTSPDKIVKLARKFQRRETLISIRRPKPYSHLEMEDLLPNGNSGDPYKLLNAKRKRI